MTGSSPRPRILELTSSARIGGAEQNLVRFLGGRDRSRFEYAVAALEPAGPLLEAVRGLGVQAVGLPGPNPFSPRLRRQLEKLLERTSPDLVHAYGLRADVVARSLARVRGTSVYVTAIRSPDPWRRFYHVWLDRWTARGGRVTLYIANSEAGRESRIQREKVPPDRVITIPNGVPLPPGPTAVEFKASPAAEALRERLSLPRGAGPLVVVVSNLRRMKGHTDLVAALVHVRERWPAARLLLAGRDESRGRVERAAVRLGLGPNVQFLGFVSDPLPLMRLSDVFCLPSHWEGCPTALIEAMSVGCTIVATRAGGIPELVRDGREALLVPPRDPARLSSALLEVLEDGALASRLAAAAQQRARRHFSLETMVRRLEDTYARLLGVS